jgi:hypothetical protein
MASKLGQPCPHAKAYTSFASPIVLDPPARGGIICSNFSTGASSVNLTTVGGEAIFLTSANNAQTDGPIYLPIQVAVINAVANVGQITVLWH